jgi:hypothetical protein
MMGYQSDYDNYKPQAHNRTHSRQPSINTTPNHVTANHARRLSSVTYKPASPPLFSRKTTRRLPVYGLITLTVLFIWAYNPLRSFNVNWACPSCSDHEWKSLADVRNETLGVRTTTTLCSR